jgi:ParB-like chromosome segregation protein Spo0J
MVIRTAPIEAAPGGNRDIDIAVDAIKLDQRAQPREHLDVDKAAEYAAAMQAGEVFPPLDVFHDGTVYWLADGFHRHYAAQNAGKKFLRCNVHPGGLREAILHSVGANAKHGLARSDTDKRRAVERLLADEEWGQWSDREIARRCHVDHKTVAKVRKGASGEIPQIERKVERGGTVYQQKVAKAPRQARQVPEEAPQPAAPVETVADVDEGRFVTITGTVVPPAVFGTALDRLVALWCEAPVEDREAFLAYLRINNQIGGVPHADRAGAVVPPQSAAPARPAKPLRPHCQKPDACGGYGAQHCRSCLRAVENA